MDIDLGVYHCQRQEVILTATEDKTVKDSEGIPATMSGRARGRRKKHSAGIRRPGDRVQPNTFLHVRARPPTST